MQQTGRAAEPSPAPLNVEEVALIQRTFKDNEPFLKTIRALFLGIDITDAEKKQVKDAFEAPDLLALFYRRFRPSIDRDASIGQLQDVWLGVEQMIFGVARDTIEQAIQYKSRAITMTEMALALLKNPYGQTVNVEYRASKPDNLGIELLARNMFVRHIEQQLSMIWLIASLSPPKTEEQKKKDTHKESKK